jgi:putative hydrolase of the HAD superfamily
MSENVISGRGARSLVRAVILDYGNVLCNPPALEEMRGMAEILGVEAEGFLEFYMPTRGPYDRGDLTPAAYWTKVAEGTGVRLNDELIEKLRKQDMEMWSSINLEMVEWAGHLRSVGLKTAILSNMESDMAAHMRKNFRWMSNFDSHTFSCEVRMIKPDEAIYRHCLQSLGVPASETLFVDDREENVEGARRVGLTAIRFESAGQLRDELEKMDFAILPAVPASRIAL